MIRKVFLATLNYDHPQTGMSRAFAGVFGSGNVAEYDYYQAHRAGKPIQVVTSEFIAAAKAFQPDWIWMQVQGSGVISAPGVEEVKKALPRCVISHWMGDLRTHVDAYLTSICRATHLTLISNRGQYDLFRSAGAPEVRYCQIGLDWDEDIIGLPWVPPFPVPDVVLCGNHYGDSFPGTGAREIAVKTLMDAHVNVGVVGGQWPRGYPVVGICTVKQQLQVYRKAKAVLSISHYNEIPGFYSDRLLIAMASGTPVVALYCPGLHYDVAWDSVYIYNDTAKLPDIVAKAMEDREIGARSRAAAIRNHSWFSRITDLLPVIEKIRAGL